jgi:hypothetical protein
MIYKTGSHLIKRIVLWASFTLGLLLAIPGAAGAGPRPRPDFNGDGFADLAVGVPNQDVGVYPDTGIVHVIYGSPGGPNPIFPAGGNQIFSAADCSWPWNGNVSGNQPGMHFGAVLAWGDFNGDGFDDLAVGIPDYNPPYPPNGMPQAGMVYVIKGSAIGLVLNQTLVLVSTNIGPPLNVNQDQGDRFGAALAAGNFNGDLSPAGHPIDDLAIGVPGQDGWELVNGVGVAIPDAGEVYVIYGQNHENIGDWRPLNPMTAQGWSQNGRTIWPDIANHPQTNDLFGSALAAGNFNGDDFDDLAIGVPGEGGGIGAVNVIYGSGIGLHQGITLLNQFWHQDIPGIAGVGMVGDRFGHSLAAGNFNGDFSPSGRPVDDLAIGAPNAAVANQVLAGEVNIILGSIGGLQVLGNQLWTQDTPGIGDDGSFLGDRFGYSLAAGNFNGDFTQAGYAIDDLAVGVPLDDPGGISSGAVNVIYGSAIGLNAFAPVVSQYWHQNSPGILGVAEPAEYFGQYLAVGDFNGGGQADLVVGVPHDSIGGIAAGAMNLIYGSPIGLSAVAGPGNQLWHQNSPGVPDACEAGDGFGVGAR